MSIRLSILGLLLEEDMHPYEIRIRMKDRFLDHKGKFRIGSLYYAVDQLAKQEHIVAMETISSNSRPDKTIYQITDKGKEYFQKLLLDKFKDIEPLYHPMYMALAFASKGDQVKIASLLRDRVKEVEHQVNLYYQVYSEHQGTVPRSVLHLMAGQYEHAMTELKWLRRLLADAEAGRLGEMEFSPLLEEDE
ncbi:PadR family transcriptional regulator [Paenibacillus anaericanus]|uniref:PadR family transcriptional regulator n=1 Tax=Paenibacillus anaericanus TaxID=170367 RepID=A0A433Y8Z6_9BACL|nr:PadR family transcriptional regulator [Paenibacillus anaericanus]RUT46383.1 PadR family transcriptional regulator [Paenibacillus anaericanus]